jgi:hypothetical protein
MDTPTPAGRSERMSRVRSKDTKPEMLVRSLVHRMGYRYRLRDRSLPGTQTWYSRVEVKSFSYMDVSGIVTASGASSQDGRSRSWISGDRS